jgi:hypothetical protein
VPPVLLIFAVLGAILGGVATPTEAAAVGAIGALLMAGRKIGINPRLILIGAAALILLGCWPGPIPVRLQRSDNGVSNGRSAASMHGSGASRAAAVGLALRAAIRESDHP